MYTAIVLYILFPSSLNPLIPRFKVLFQFGGKSQFKNFLQFVSLCVVAKWQVRGNNAM